MKRRSILPSLSLLLLLGGCGYVTLGQIPCTEDSECPSANHCGPAGYCAPGIDIIQADRDAGFEAPVDAGVDAGFSADAGDPTDAGSPQQPPPDAGFAVDAGSPTPAIDAGHAGLDAGVVDAGPAAGGACTDTSDEALLAQSSEQSALTSCAENNLNYMNQPMVSLYEPQTLTCIEGTGLSTPCAQCVDTEESCVVSNCAYQCYNTGSTVCASCTAMYCTPAFNTCSGL